MTWFRCLAGRTRDVLRLHKPLIRAGSNWLLGNWNGCRSDLPDRRVHCVAPVKTLFLTLRGWPSVELVFSCKRLYEETQTREPQHRQQMADGQNQGVRTSNHDRS